MCVSSAIEAECLTLRSSWYRTGQLGRNVQKENSVGRAPEGRVWKGTRRDLKFSGQEAMGREKKKLQLNNKKVLDSGAMMEAARKQASVPTTPGCRNPAPSPFHWPDSQSTESFH